MIMQEFDLIPPRDEVEIHLPDGHVLSGPRGAKVGEFLSAIDHDCRVAQKQQHSRRPLTQQ